MIRKVVITGGSGFLGSALAMAALKLGWQVTAVSRHSEPTLIAEGVKFVLVDISDSDSLPLLEAAFEGVDVVFHTAAKSDIWGHWRAFRRANIYGTQNVLAAAKSAGVKNFVYTSSPSVVYTGGNIINGNESLPYCKVWKESYYAFTKAKAEQLVLEANSPDFHTVSLRPHLIWGQGDTRLMPTLLKHVCAGKLRMIGEGYNIVSLTHISNAVRAHILAAQALDEGNPAPCGKAYFVTDQENINLWQWFNRILSGLGIPELKKEDAMTLASARRAAWFAEQFWHIFSIAGTPPMTRFVATHLACTHTFSSDAAVRDFGYSSVIDVEQETKNLIESLKEA